MQNSSQSYLAELFGSTTKVKIIDFFLHHPKGYQGVTSTQLSKQLGIGRIGLPKILSELASYGILNKNPYRNTAIYSTKVSKDDIVTIDFGGGEVKIGNPTGTLAELDKEIRKKLEENYAAERFRKLGV